MKKAFRTREEYPVRASHCAIFERTASNTQTEPLADNDVARPQIGAGSSRERVLDTDIATVHVHGECRPLAWKSACPPWFRRLGHLSPPLCSNPTSRAQRHGHMHEKVPLAVSEYILNYAVPSEKRLRHLFRIVLSLSDIRWTTVLERFKCAYLHRLKSST